MIRWARTEEAASVEFDLGASPQEPPGVLCDSPVFALFNEFSTEIDTY